MSLLAHLIRLGFPLFLLCCVIVSIEAQTPVNYVWRTNQPGTTGSSSAASYDANLPAPTFSFLSLPSPATYGLGDDVFSGTVQLGFTFEFYGQGYTQGRISTNGYFTFHPTATNAWNLPPGIPYPTGTSSPNPLIAPFWTDLDPSRGGSIQTQTIGSVGSRIFVLQFINVPYYVDWSVTVTFQVQLFEGSNRIQFDYQSLPRSNNQRNVAIGVTNPTGTVGTAYVNAVQLPLTSYSGFSLTIQTPSNIAGDPQFVGLQGQHYQVHGQPGEVFNLISAPSFSLNAHFVYLSSGGVCDYNNTACFSHPGTYIDRLGFLIGDQSVKVVADSHSSGLRVWLNDQQVLTTSVAIGNTASIALTGHDQMTVRTSQFLIQVTNSDHFFNLQVSLLDDKLLQAGALPFRAEGSSSKQLAHLYPAAPVHGLLGQTWKNVVYEGNHPYEGEIEDYLIASGQLTDPKFIFSQFY